MALLANEMKLGNWRDLLISLSISNLLFVSGWRRLIYPNSHVYHIKALPSYFDYTSIILLVILAAGIIFGGACILRYFFKGEIPFLGKLGFLGLVFCVLNAIRLTFYEFQAQLTGTIGMRSVLIILAVLGMIGLVTVWKLRSRVFAIASSMILVLSPFVFVTFGQALVGAAYNKQSKKADIAETQVHKLKKEIKARVVWIVFDELDYRIPFETRPDDLKLPEFDRLSKESFSALNAASPDYETRISIPALIVGKELQDAKPYGKGDMLLWPSDEAKPRKFSEVPNVFSAVKKLGGNSAVVGWYHAYCRVFRKELSACHWESYDYRNDFESDSLSESIRRDLNNWVLSMPMVVRFLSNFQDQAYIERHERLISNTQEVVNNRDIDLSLIHMTVPHTPYRYSRSEKRFVGSGDYFDNLALTDRVLGTIRRGLESSKLWEDSTIIVSSDHPWRINQLMPTLTDREVKVSNGKEDPRIPFIIKLKDQNESVKYDKPLNTVVTSDLILEIMNGNILTAAEVKNWLDERAQNRIGRSAE